MTGLEIAGVALLAYILTPALVTAVAAITTIL
jgi:hypothetical protein